MTDDDFTLGIFEKPKPKKGSIEERYENLWNNYKKKFGKPPPTIGSIYDVESIEYIEWVEKAIADNKAIDLSQYYPKGANY